MYRSGVVLVVVKRVNKCEVDSEKVERMKDMLLFSVAEVASILSCSERKVFRLVQNQKIIPVGDRPGRKGIRITGKALEEYIESITIDPSFWKK